MSTRIIVFPFDLFGNAGTAAGAELLGDAVREMLADNRREAQPTRAAAYQSHVRLREQPLTTTDDLTAWRTTARKLVRTALRTHELLIWLTGNHLGVLPLYDELADSDTLVLHLDAHLDIYNLTDCTEDLSHGNFLRSARTPRPPILHVGHRDLFLPLAAQREFFRAIFPAEQLVNDFSRVCAAISARVQSAQRVVIDLDCDVLDPAYFPAVGQPLPFGLTPQQVLQIVNLVPSEKLVGWCVSEFMPAHDQRDHSLGLLLWLLEYVLLRKYETPNDRED